VGAAAVDPDAGPINTLCGSVDVIPVPPYAIVTVYLLVNISKNALLVLFSFTVGK